MVRFGDRHDLVASGVFALAVLLFLGKPAVSQGSVEIHGVRILDAAFEEVARVRDRRDLRALERLWARLAPAELRTEMFGLYALSGKATAFIGPALVGWVTLWAGSQRIGMATIMLFFAAGWLLLLPVREPR